MRGPRNLVGWVCILVATLISLGALVTSCSSAPAPASPAPAAPAASAPAASAPAAPGITDSGIRIGAFAALTGALGGSGSQFVNGANAYYKYLNEQGGINGRKVEWTVENDEYNPQQALAVSKKLVERDGIFAIVGGFGTATALAVLPYVLEKQVPFVAPLGSAAAFLDSKEKWVFGAVPLGPAHGESLGRYAVNELKAKRVAVLYQNDQYGKDGLDGVISALKAAGLQAVATEPHEPDVTDVSATVVKVKNLNPDAVVLFSTAKAASLILKEARTQGWRPKFLAPNPLADPNMLDLAGAEALEGMVNNYFVELGVDVNKKVQDKIDLLRKYYPSTQAGYFAFNGMISAMIFAEGARKAGRNLTRDSFVQGLESLKDFETDLTGPITYGPGKHSGVSKYGFVQWSGGKLKKISDWQ